MVCWHKKYNLHCIQVRKIKRSGCDRVYRARQEHHETTASLVRPTHIYKASTSTTIWSESWQTALVRLADAVWERLCRTGELRARHARHVCAASCSTKASLARVGERPPELQAQNFVATTPDSLQSAQHCTVECSSEIKLKWKLFYWGVHTL